MRRSSRSTHRRAMASPGTQKGGGHRRSENRRKQRGGRRAGAPLAVAHARAGPNPTRLKTPTNHPPKQAHDTRSTTLKAMLALRPLARAAAAGRPALLHPANNGAAATAAAAVAGGSSSRAAARAACAVPARGLAAAAAAAGDGKDKVVVAEDFKVRRGDNGCRLIDWNRRGCLEGEGLGEYLAFLPPSKRTAPGVRGADEQGGARHRVLHRHVVPALPDYLPRLRLAQVRQPASKAV